MACDPQNKKLPFIANHQFNQRNLAQIKDKVGLLKEFAKKKSELYSKGEISRPEPIELTEFNEHPKRKENKITSFFQYDQIQEKYNDYDEEEEEIDRNYKKSHQSIGSINMHQNSQVSKSSSKVYLQASQRLLTEISSMEKIRFKDNIKEGDVIKTESYETFDKEEGNPFGISNERLNLLRLILKVNKDSKVFEVNTNPNEKTLACQQIFDEVASDILFKEENDPIFLPFEDYFGKKAAFNRHINEISSKDEALVGSLPFAEDVGNNNESLAHIRSKMQVSQLNNILSSKNDVLKYQYIEIIRQGKEDELLKYLLSEKKISDNEEIEMALKRRLRVHKKSLKPINHKYEKGLLEEVKITKKKLTSGLPNIILQKIEKSLRSVDRILGNSVEYYEKLKKTEAKQLMEGISLYEDKDVFMAKKYKKIVEQAEERNSKQLKAKQAREQIVKEKEDNIQEKIHRKSIEYKKQLAKKRIEEEIFSKKISKLMSSLNVFLLFSLLNKISEEGLEFKRKMFHFNMKSRILQNYFKKISVILKILKILSIF